MRPSFIEPLESRIAPATIAIAPNFIVDEGDTTDGTATIAHVKVRLDAAATQQVTVEYSIASGTAVLNSEFTPVLGPSTGTLTFAPGDVEQMIDVKILGNTTVDNDSAFTVNLSNASTSSNISDNSTTVTIWDDDRVVSFAPASQNQHHAEGDSGVFNLPFTVNLSAPAQHAITVAYGTAAGTGANGAISTGSAADFNAAAGNLTFDVSGAAKSFNVGLRGDVLPGPDENFSAVLSQPATGPYGYKLGTSTTTATIDNDDANTAANALTVSLIGDISTSEGATALFGVRLSRLSESPVVIGYHTSDGTAKTVDLDYTGQSAGSKTIVSVQQDAIPVSILPIGGTDSNVEGAETFTLTLDGASVNGIPIGLGATKTATATIIADPLPKLKIDNVQVIEPVGSATAQAVFTVSLQYDDNTAANPHHFTLSQGGSFHYTTVNGSATGSATGANADFTIKANDITFAAGRTDQSAPFTITVPISKDAFVEPTETFTVKLSNAVGAAVGDDTGTGTIVDANIDLKVTDVSVSEGNSGSSSAIFTLALGKPVPTGYQLKVDYQNVDAAGADAASSTADASRPSQDYVALPLATLTFAAGSSAATVAVQVNGDQVLEGNETFNLKVTNARLVPLAAPTTSTPVGFAGASDTQVLATGTIVNDDGPALTAAITANAATLQEGAANSTAEATFAVHLSSAYSTAVDVSYTITKLNSDGTTSTFVHTAGSSTLPALRIPAFAQDGTINVDFSHEGTVGRDQILNVTLTGVKSATSSATFQPLASARTAKTIILEDDAWVKIFSANKAEGNGGTSLLPFAVELVAIDGNTRVHVDHAVTASFATFDGGAVSTGQAPDYVAGAGSFTIPAGQNGVAIGVSIIGDTLGGSDESFGVRLSAPTGAGFLPDSFQAYGTIRNDDGAAPLLTLLPSTPGVEPGAAGGALVSPAVFTYKLAQAAEGPVSFDFATSVLTAAQFAALQPNSPDGNDLAAQNDFAPRSTPRIVIPSGQLTGTIEVTPLADTPTAGTLNEKAEHFGLTLSNITGASNASGSTLQAVGTIAANDQPTLTVANITTLEGASGTHNAAFTVKLSQATNVPVTFNVQTVPTGTATAGVDYATLASTPITIAAGQTQATANVVINGDATKGEGDETFIFRVSNVQNAIPGSVDAVGTILADEASFSIAPPATATAENSEVVSFKVTRTDDLTVPADVTFKTVDGTAKSTGALLDFIGGVGTLHFAPGASEAFIRIALVDDNRHEGSETFSVQLTSATNGVLGTPVVAAATINDNDAIPTATILSPAAIAEKDSGSTPATFTIALDHANDESAVVFKVSTADGSAHAGADYTGLSNQTVTIPIGALSATFTVPVLNDLVHDSAKTETFKANVTLDPANTGDAKAKLAGGATSLIGTGSIVDNEAAPQISLAPATFDEGTASTFVAQLNRAADLPVTVKYYTVDGTAKSTGAAADFTGKTSAAPGVLTFAPGSTSATINTITANDDNLTEGNETFRLQLASPVGATLNPATTAVVGTIADTDHAYLSVNDVSLVEGDAGTQDAIFTVTLLGDTVNPVSVKFATSSAAPAAGVATAGSDYTATSGTLTLGGAAGVHSAQVKVRVAGDLVKEVDEHFNLTLSEATVATIVRATGLGTIIDDGDTQGTISVNDDTVVEGDTANTMLHYTATLSDPAPTGGVTFTVHTSEPVRAANVARLNADFLQPKSTSDPTKDQSFTIAAGATSMTFDIAVVADSLFEATEFLNVTLTNITGAQPGHVTGTGTIYDNDVILTPTVAKWTDIDGDLVTLTTSKGNLGNVGFGGLQTSAGTVGGHLLTQLNLVATGTTFNHANLSIISAQQPDAAGALTGDGLVNVGYIRANTLDTAPSVLETTGIDLGTLKVDGDLSRINVGDLFSNAAVTLLDVGSLGTKTSVTDTANGAGPAVSQFLAGASTIKVAHDVSGVIEVTGGTSGRIGTLNIGGALRGTAAADSARILVTGAIGSATIHDIIGGAGARSASLTQFDQTAVLGSLTVTGDITAGSGSQTAHILFPTIGSVTVHGSMHGGFISGSNSVGTVTIDGNMDMGAKLYGGALTNNHAFKSVVIHGNVNNGSILGGYIANINDTAANQVTKANADAQIDSVQVDGTVLKMDILAGTDPASTAAFLRDDVSLFSRIAKVVFNGDLQNNSELHYISAETIGSIIVQGVAKTPTLTGVELEPGTNFLLKYAP